MDPEVCNNLALPETADLMALMRQFSELSLAIVHNAVLKLFESDNVIDAGVLSTFTLKTTPLGLTHAEPCLVYPSIQVSQFLEFPKQVAHSVLQGVQAEPIVDVPEAKKNPSLQTVHEAESRQATHSVGHFVHVIAVEVERR